MSKRKYHQIAPVYERLIILGSSTMTPKQRDKYVREKIRMLYRDFLIPVTDADKEYLYSLDTEDAIDRACSRIIKERL